MIRSLFIVAIILITVPCSGEMIGDFAPIKAGNTWEYSQYDSTFYPHPYGNAIILMHISISILEISMHGSDTIVQLMVTQDSSYTFDGNAGGPVHFQGRDTVTFFDTVVIKGDSIIKPSTYHCSVFPFCNEHYLNKDSLQPVNVNNQTLFSFTNSILTIYTPPGHLSFLQNIGLYSRTLVLSMGNQIISTNLISFNSIDIKVDVKQYKTSLNTKTPVPSMKKYLLIGNKDFYPKNCFYNLYGRKISVSNKMPPGLYFQLH
jgi:hypothetical protein